MVDPGSPLTEDGKLIRVSFAADINAWGSPVNLLNLQFMVLVRTLSALVVGLRGKKRARCVACSSTTLVNQPNSRGKWVNPLLTVMRKQK